MKPKTKVGDVFSRLTVLSFAQGKPLLSEAAEFLCECGKVKSIRLAHVTTGTTVSCGCVKIKNRVEVGQVFGRLTVISSAMIPVGRHLKAMCRCECGAEKLIGISELCTGVTKSCGCLVIEQISKLALKHGCEQHPAYKVWTGIRERCLNEKSKSYHRYGGRGIKICDAWLADCKVFCDWADANGSAPGLEIDRKDNNGNYEPENCHFVTPKENCRNRRSNVPVTAFGETKILVEWSEDHRCVVGYDALWIRINKGINPELAITTPVNQLI